MAVYEPFSHSLEWNGICGAIVRWNIYLNASFMIYGMPTVGQVDSEMLRILFEEIKIAT